MMGYSDFWIGFSDIDSEGTFVWADGSSSTFTYWGSGEPNDDNFNEDCTEIRAAKNGTWNDKPCSYESRFVCKTCLEGFTLYNGNCYFLSSETATWLDASTICDIKGSSLATITSLDESLAVYEMMGYSDFWIGFSDIDSEGTFVWADGSSSTFTYWGSGEPNDDNFNEDCTEIRAAKNGTWNDQPCSYERRFVCKSNQEHFQGGCSEDAHTNALVGGNFLDLDCMVSQCPEGYYCPDNSVEKLVCPAGYSCPAGSVTLTPCPEGYFCPNGSVVLLCSTGNFCPNQSASMVPCTPGHICQAKGMGQPGDPCLPGFYCPLGSTSMLPCSEGYICPDSRMSAVGWRCDPGYFCPEQSTEMVVCEAGFYCTEGSAEMIPCPSGSYCGAVGMDSPGPTCQEGFFCEEGAVEMKPCLAGHICPDSGMSSVGPGCEAGFVCPLQSLEMALCPPGKYCPYPKMWEGLPCPPGSYCLPGTEQPSPCPSGYICPNFSMAVPGDICTPGFYCPFGSVTMHPCAEHHYCPEKSANMTRCDVGHFCPYTLMESPLPCPTDHYCPTPGLIEPLPCFSTDASSCNTQGSITCHPYTGECVCSGLWVGEFCQEEQDIVTSLTCGVLALFVTFVITLIILVYPYLQQRKVRKLKFKKRDRMTRKTQVPLTAEGTGRAALLDGSRSERCLLVSTPGSSVVTPPPDEIVTAALLNRSEGEEMPLVLTPNSSGNEWSPSTSERRERSDKEASETVKRYGGRKIHPIEAFTWVNFACIVMLFGVIIVADATSVLGTVYLISRDLAILKDYDHFLGMGHIIQELRKYLDSVSWSFFQLTVFADIFEVCVKWFDRINLNFLFFSNIQVTCAGSISAVLLMVDVLFLLMLCHVLRRKYFQRLQFRLKEKMLGKTGSKLLVLIVHVIVECMTFFGIYALQISVAFLNIKDLVLPPYSSELCGVQDLVIGVFAVIFMTIVLPIWFVKVIEAFVPTRHINLPSGPWKTLLISGQKVKTLFKLTFGFWDQQMLNDNSRLLLPAQHPHMERLCSLTGTVHSLFWQIIPGCIMVQKFSQYSNSGPLYLFSENKVPSNFKTFLSLTVLAGAMIDFLGAVAILFYPESTLVNGYCVFWLAFKVPKVLDSFAFFSQ